MKIFALHKNEFCRIESDSWYFLKCNNFSWASEWPSLGGHSVMGITTKTNNGYI